MWVFIFLCVMGLNIHQVTGEEKSKQMYYAKLTIDENAIENITEILKPFAIGHHLKADFLKITTTCENALGVTQCTCSADYKWSDEVCRSKKECCGDKTCNFTQKAVPMCISQTTILTGSLTIKGKNYSDCLADNTSMLFQTCNNNLLKEIKKVYSSLNGFDILHITKYSIGSIVADFVVNFASEVNSDELIKKSETLLQTLSASLYLETTGFVTLDMPNNPVRYNSRQNLKCVPKSKLDAQPVWKLKQNDHSQLITNGTESEILTDTHHSSLTLKNATETWAGEYSCTYPVKSKSYTIKHIARAVMNVSLLPVIDITLIPSFPNCQQKELVKVKVMCEVEKSQEKYDVTWTKKSITAAITPQPTNHSQVTVVYAAETVIICTPATPKPQIACTFTNRRTQTRKAPVWINIIFDGERFCKEDGDWEVTKAGFVAMLRCKNADGYRKRKCDNLAKWKQEESECVKPFVNHLLASANAVDSGFGLLDENAARVLRRFERVTNNTKQIQGPANIKASVDVLFTLSEKLNYITDNSTIEDLLDSSSNLLEKSLKTSWTENLNEGNQSAAEMYLTSVEHLIELTNISGTITKKNVEVAVCLSNQGSKCNNTVHNATVSIDNADNSDYGTVKTAAFQQLQEYLPHGDNETAPNSIVVSTTIEKKKEPVEVKIDFRLLKSRPHNVEMHCVSWNNNTRQWSSDGCEWKGGARCICTHLSSFAILMSKRPIKLPAMEEITLVGLSISSVSLAICIVIQLMVWSTVVKSNTLYIRQVAHFNISVCLLVGDCCFLASRPEISKPWCVTVTVLKHFCFLSMFFWMLCLSCILLCQAVFVFHNVGKKIYLKCAVVLGYVCPFLIVSITFLSYSAGAENSYYSMETCWLVYSGPFKGSIHSFVLPIAVIVFINVFTMVVVIVKLLDLQKAETANENDKSAAKTVMRTVILLTPVFGVTWLLGFGVMLLDLTSGYLVYAINYAFNLLNAFQGLFILLTTCLGDKTTRDALLRRFRKVHASASITESTTKLDSSLK